MAAAAFGALDANTLVLPDLNAIDLADAAVAHRRLEAGQAAAAFTWCHRTDRRAAAATTE